MSEIVQCEECTAVHGVPTLHSPDSHAQGAVSGYGLKPMGIPYVAHMNEDLSFTIVAAGHDQVERYSKAKSPEEYLAGEETAQTGRSEKQ